MKSSYKIAIISAVVLLIMVFTYYLRMDKPGIHNSAADGTNTENANQQTTAAPASDSAASLVSAPTGANNPPNVDELVARVRSHLDKADQPAGTAAPATQPAPSPAAALPPATQPAAGLSTADRLPPRGIDIFATPPGDHRLTEGSTATLGQASTPSTTYKIAAGDTLASVAQKLYNSPARWRDIAEANPLVDPTRLKVGQVIKLPGTTANSSTTSLATNVTHARATEAVTYTVRASDTLSSIARQYYSDGELWKVIYNANKATIGPRPDHLREGMKLTIPPAPTPAKSRETGTRTQRREALTARM